MDEHNHGFEDGVIFNDNCPRCLQNLKVLDWINHHPDGEAADSFEVLFWKLFPDDGHL